MKSWKFLRDFRRNVPEKFYGISSEKFLRNSQEFRGKNSWEILWNFSRLWFSCSSQKHPKKLVTKFWEFFKNFWRNIPEKFSGISWGQIPERFSGTSRNFVFYSVLQIIRKIYDQVLRISNEFSEKYSGEILRNFSNQVSKLWSQKKTLKLRNNSGEFLENFREIIYKNLFSWNPSDILQSKSPKL